VFNEDEWSFSATDFEIDSLYFTNNNTTLIIELNTDFLQSYFSSNVSITTTSIDKKIFSLNKTTFFDGFPIIFDNLEFSFDTTIPASLK